MIVYDKEQKQIVIPNGLGNVNIIINQGCDDDKPTPPQDGWGMTGVFNNWGESPDIPFKENGEWEGRPYKVIRNFGATGGEFKIRRNNAWTDSYTASFHNEPQFAQLLKNDFSMSINDGVWDIYLFFGDDGEPNEMLILRPGTDLSTIQYEYTLTISTDKENAIIEIADSYRGMTDRYCGDVTVTMKYGCIYYINVYMEGYEDISDEITCYNDEQRNYTLTKTKYNTIADIYGSPSDSTVTFKGLVALSFDYKSGKNILFTDHTGSIILKNCQEPLKVGDECLVTATLRRFDTTYISDLSNASVEVLSSNNYVVMPTDAVELTNLDDLYIPNEYGYAEMKYLYADGTVVSTTFRNNFMRIKTDVTSPDGIALRGDFSDWEGKLVEGDNIRVYMFPENNQGYFWATDIIKLETCNLGTLDWTLTSQSTEVKNASDDGYDGYSQVIVRPENLIAQEKENAINDFKNKMDEITITKNGIYSTEDQGTLNSIAFDGNSYFNTGIFPTENIKIEACIKITNGNDSGLGGIIIGGGIGRLGENTENRGIAIGMGSGAIYGVWGAKKSFNKPYKYEGEGTITVVLQKTDDSWGWDGEKGPFGASGLYIGGYNSNDIAVEKRFLQSIVYIKIWTDRNDDSTLITYTPKTNGNFDANGVELQRLGEGTTTFVEENVKKYPNGFKRVEVNVPDLNGSYNEGYAQGKTDGINEQKSKLESISITENGTYTKEDGYNHIEVNVPDLNGSYDEGYNQGKIDGVNEQKSKLETINITENGTYRKEDGYNEIVVEVPGSSGDYNKGYEQGQADVVANARVLNVTENGTYKSKFTDLPLTVTGVYADGTEFNSYAELSNKIFNTKIAATIDSRLEFWYKGDYKKNTNNNNVIIGSGNNNDKNSFQVRYNLIFNDRIIINIGDKSISITNWNDRDWHHLIISKAEGLWIDGEKKGDFSPTNTIDGEFFINGIGYKKDGKSSANGTFGMIKIDDTIIIPTEDGFLNTNTRKLLEVVNDGGYTFTGELYKTINVNVPPKINPQKEGLRLGYSTFTKVPDWVNFNGITNMNNMFKDCKSLQTIPEIDTSKVTDMSYMLFNCTNLQTIPLLNTSRVTNMNSMFGYCNLKTIPLLNTSNVTDMSHMFFYCSNLQTIPQIDTSKVTNMDSMFVNCTSLVSLPSLNAQSLSMNQYSSFFAYTELPKLTDFGGLLNLKCSLTSDGNFNKLPNLTYESCINVLNGLYDFTGNGETPNNNQGKLKVHQNFLDKVGDEISIGTAKGWTITV